MKKFVIPFTIVLVTFVLAGAAFAQDTVDFVQLPSEQLSGILVLAGVPLGAVIFILIEMLKLFGKAIGTAFFDTTAVWWNLVLSILAFALVFVWQLGYLPEGTTQTLVAIFTFLTTFASAAGIYNLTAQSGVFPSRKG